MSETTEAVRERPVLFSGPMVRAILEGRKTMTRRVVKPQPPTVEAVRKLSGSSYSLFTDRHTPGAFRVAGPVWAVRELTGLPDPKWRCPYEGPGDLLVVKEAAWMWCERRPNGTTPTGRPKWLYVPLRSAPVHYAADHPAGARPAGRVVSPDTGNEWGWRLKVARFLPRWASRITLEITDVRVERLGEITEEDARAEGLSCWTKDGSLYKWGVGRRHVSGELDATEPWADLARSPTDAFRRLWDSLNAERGYGWDANPWVWRIEFRNAAEAPHAR